MAYRYIDLDFLAQVMDKRNIVQLSVDDDTVDIEDFDNVDDDVVEACENNAAYIVDNYLRRIFAIPLAGSNLTPEIKFIVADLTRVSLWRRRDYLTTVADQLHAEAIERLKRISQRDHEVREGQTIAKVPART